MGRDRVRFTRAGRMSKQCGKHLISTADIQLLALMTVLQENNRFRCPGLSDRRCLQILRNLSSSAGRLRTEKGRMHGEPDLIVETAIKAQHRGGRVEKHTHDMK